MTQLYTQWVESYGVELLMGMYLRGGAVNGHVLAVQIPVLVVEQNRLVFVRLRQKLNVWKIISHHVMTVLWHMQLITVQLHVQQS